MIPTFNTRRPYLRRRRFRVAGPLPIENVVFVYRYDETHVLWFFADEVAGVDGPCPGLRVGGREPVDVVIFDTTALLCTYDGGDLQPGLPWQLVADDVQLTFDPPHRLVDATGTVEG